MMGFRLRFAEVLRRVADRLDPPQIRELQIPPYRAEIRNLDGFEQVEPIEPPPDWTWTQGSPPWGYL